MLTVTQEDIEAKKQAADVFSSLKAVHLNKIFGKTAAIKDVSFNLPVGKITGLVGPDGAGKTTLIRLLLGLLLPSGGEISLAGLNPETQMREIHQITGYMPQKFGLYEDLTVLENMNLYADLKGVEGKEKEESFKELLKFTSLADFTDRLAGRLSGGMKQKLGLACALLGEPRFLLLDEPGVGVDPISRRELMAMVRNLSRGGMTILWSTSYLDEAEGFDNVLLLNEGKLLYEGKPGALTKKEEGSVFLMEKEGTTPRRLLRSLLKSGKPIVDAVVQGDAVRVVVKDKKTQEEYRKFLTPVPPRFEDAVIDILGGTPLGESLVAKEVSVSSGFEEMIQAEHLTKQYGSFKAADDITFTVKKGEIFGLLGPNGAGKSTTFKMMCGLSRPTKGQGFVRGINMQKKPERAREKLGYMAQKFSLFSPLTVLQNLTFFSGIYRLKGEEQQKRIAQMVDIFNLEPYLASKAGELPLGYKQRLALACAIMHNPSVLFLDEPTSGVDPLTRREFWNHINSMVEKGVTVMVTTHFMDEAEYCDRIALIYKGRAIKIGAPSDIKKKGETMEDAFIRVIEEYEGRDSQKKDTLLELKGKSDSLLPSVAEVSGSIFSSGVKESPAGGKKSSETGKVSEAVLSSVAERKTDNSLLRNTFDGKGSPYFSSENKQDVSRKNISSGEGISASGEEDFEKGARETLSVRQGEKIRDGHGRAGGDTGSFEKETPVQAQKREEKR